MSRAAHADVRTRARAVVAAARRLGRCAGVHHCARRRGQIAAPPRYKTAAVTWLAIYPLVLGLSTLLVRLELGLPPALSILVVTLVTVLLATYVALPVLSRLLRPWLVPSRDRTASFRTDLQLGADPRHAAHARQEHRAEGDR